MNAPLDLNLDKAAFLAWLDRQERKYEWKEGRIVQIPDVSKAHARLVANFLHAFSAHVDLDRWAVTASDLGIEGETWLRFPDVIVEPMDRDDKGRRSRDPVFIVEVLSPSSVGTDLTLKPAEYLPFSSLQAYIVASQDEPIVWVWQRNAQSNAFPERPAEIQGRAATLSVARPDLAIPLAELYRGIGVS